MKIRFDGISLEEPESVIVDTNLEASLTSLGNTVHSTYDTVYVRGSLR